MQMAMPIRRVVADQKVVADRGRVAIERGPLVYCLEDIDNAQAVDGAILPDGATLSEVRSASPWNPEGTAKSWSLQWRGMRRI